MDLGAFFFVFSKFFALLSWPPCSFICPLCVSIMAVESKSYSKNQQCLTYWVLFSLITILEMALGSLFEWLPFWPCAKSIVMFVLVVPYFSGSSYVYEHFIRPKVCKESQIGNFLFVQHKDGLMLQDQADFFDTATQGNIVKNEGDELFTFQGNHVPSYNAKERAYNWLPSPRKVQKEWSCALCLVTASSEKCLNEHLQGRKHNVKETELREDDHSNKITDNSPSVQKRTDGMILFKNVNHIPWVNFEKLSGALNPVSRPFRRCKWEKPERGWTKLNTDGSIDRDNAGFGGLFRDHVGKPLCAFVSKATRDDIFLVELWAIWRGLVLALGMEIKVIWVESDSMSVVKSINRQQPYSPKAGSCLQRIWEMLKKFEKYRVSHSWRETNGAADFLSKMMLTGTDVVLWPSDFPESLWNIIKDDAQGRVYFRG